MIQATTEQMNLKGLAQGLNYGSLAGFDLITF